MHLHHSTGGQVDLACEAALGKVSRVLRMWVAGNEGLLMFFLTSFLGAVLSEVHHCPTWQDT